MSRSSESQTPKFNCGVVEHQLLVSPGLSGAPLLVLSGETPRVIGIHKCGRHDNSSGLALQIQRAMVENISEWVCELGGNPLVVCD